MNQARWPLESSKGKSKHGPRFSHLARRNHNSFSRFGQYGKSFDASHDRLIRTSINKNNDNTANFRDHVVIKISDFSSKTANFGKEKSNMSSTLTRRRLVLAAAVLPLGASVNFLPKVALACHDYVSRVDGARGCSAYKRDGSSSSSSSSGSTSSSQPTSEASQPQSSSTPSSSSSPSGLVYQDELVGFNKSRKSGQSGRFFASRAPDGKPAIEVIYQKGKPACAAMSFLDIFPGNGVSRATFECDLWFQSGFQGPPGKLFGVYGGGDAAGGLVAGKPGCQNPEGGWASRVCHDYANRVLLYSYAQNRPMSCTSDGKKFGKTYIQRATLPTNGWVTFRQEVVMNTPGNSNGNEKVWMGGSLLFDMKGQMYQRQSDRYGIKGWSIFNMYGGSCRSSSFFPTANLSVWYRNLKVFT